MSSKRIADDVVSAIVRNDEEQRATIDALRAENDRLYQLGIAMAEQVAELGAASERLRRVVDAARRYRDARVGHIEDGTQATAWVALARALQELDSPR